MTIPNFTAYAESLPNPKADRWDALVRGGMSPEAATQQVTQEFTTNAKAAPAIARRGPATGASQLVQGFGFGFGDEANAAADAVGDKTGINSIPANVRAVMDRVTGAENPRPFVGRNTAPIGEQYRERLSEERARQALYTTAKPGTSIALQLAGGLAGGLAGVSRAGAARAAVGGGEALPAVPGLMTRIAKGAGMGAGAGAIGGLGNSEATGAAMLGDAATGAFVGGGLGGAIPAAGALLGLLPRGARAIKGAISPPTLSREIAADATLPVVGGAPVAIPAQAGGAVVQAPPMPIPTAAPTPARSFGDFLRGRTATNGGATTPPAVPPTRNAMDGAMPTTDAALLRLGRALQEDKLTPDALRGMRNQAAPSELIADITGPQTQRLVRGSEAVPSAGSSEIKNVLTARQGAQNERVQTGIAKAFGVDEQPDLVAAARTLETQRRAASSRAYREAYEVAPGEPRTVPSSLLSGLLDDPVFARAMQRAKQQFALDVRTGDAVTTAPIFRDVVTDVLDDGTPIVELGERVPVALVDYLKKGLDSVIQAGDDGRPMDRAAARSYRLLKNRLLEAVDREVPEYQVARQTHAGGMAMEEALQAGREATKRDTSRAELADALSDLTGGEAEQFRLGALGQLLEDTANVSDGRDVMASVAKSPALREKIAMLLPDEAARESFAALVASEARQTGTRRAIQGSRTAPLLQDVAELTNTDGASALGNVLRGPVAAVKNAAGAVGDRLAAAERTQMADQLAPLLMMPARDVEAVLKMVAGATGRRAASIATRRAATTGVSGVAGGGTVRP